MPIFLNDMQPISDIGYHGIINKYLVFINILNLNLRFNDSPCICPIHI
jgi:hypothetical protein